MQKTATCTYTENFKPYKTERLERRSNMKKNSKKLIALLAVFCMATSAAALAACDKKDSASVEQPPVASSPVETDEVYEIYKLYVASAGENPLSYEDWLATIKGDKGDPGTPGTPGQAGVSITNAEIVDGELVLSFSDGTTKNVGQVVGQDGQDGAPGQNGNDGAPGQNGNDGAPGQNGNDGAPGKDGNDGAPGKDGKDGVSITKVELNDDGELVIYFSEGDPTNLGVITSGNGAAVSHVHSLGETMVILAPTGLEDGVGCKVCADCGEMIYVNLPKIVGAIEENPVELTIGETTEIKVNDYNSDRYGVHVDKGQKGVVYTKVTVTENGRWLSLPTDIGDDASVDYEFYYFYEDRQTGEIMKQTTDRCITLEATGMNTTTWETTYAPREVYVKMTFSGNYPATVNVTPRLANLPTEGDRMGLAEHTITLSQGTATGLIVRSEYGDVWLNETNYVAFNGTNQATVWLEPGAYTFEIEGLDSDYCFVDSSEFVMPFADDGSNDEGGEHLITVGKQYEYSFTVTDANGNAVEGALVSVSNGKTLTTDANGATESVFLPETLVDGSFVFDYTVSVTNVGFKNNELVDVALVLADDEAANYVKALTVAAADISTLTLETAFEVTDVEHRAVIDIAEAGEYTFEITAPTATDNMWKYYGSGVTVNGVVLFEPANDSAQVLATVELAAGEQEIVINTRAWDLGYDTMYLTVKAVPKPEGIQVGTEMDAEIGKEYVFTATTAATAGTYKFSFTSETMSDVLVYRTKADAEADNGYNAWIDGTAVVAGEQEAEVIQTLEVLDEFSFYFIGYGGAEISVTVLFEKLPNEVTIDTETDIVLEDKYVFTATEEGTYKLAFDTESLGDTLLYYTVAGGSQVTVDGAELNNNNLASEVTFTLKANESVNFRFTGVEWNSNYYAPNWVKATVSKVVEGGEEEAGNVLTLNTPTKVTKGEAYTFTATFTGQIWFTSPYALEEYTDLLAPNWLQVANINGSSTTEGFVKYYDSDKEYSAAFNVVEGETYTFWVTQARGDATLTITDTEPVQPK